MNRSLVMDSDECGCSSTGRLKETSQERKKLPNAEVVQIERRVEFDRKREKTCSLRLRPYKRLARPDGMAREI